MVSAVSGLTMNASSAVFLLRVPVKHVHSHGLSMVNHLHPQTFAVTNFLDIVVG